MTDFISPILSASTLQQLCDAMNDAGDEIARLQREGEDARLLIFKYDQAVQRCAVFSDSMPCTDFPVWSWDADGLLVGEGWGQCEIVARDMQ